MRAVGYWRMAKRTDIEEHLRRAILDCGMTRADISRRSGVAEAILSFFVNGKRTMTLPTAAKVARVLGLRLVGGGPVKPRPKRKTGPKPKAEKREGR